MVIELKAISYYELDDIMKEMERRGFMPKRKFWQDYACEWGVNNDTIFKLGFKYYEFHEKEEMYREYFTEVNRMLGLPLDNESIMVRVSW
ncbi:hypothetical protein [Bacillus phage PK16]|nr:hypothetical protein [Bacillus phage PK16]AUM58925.1 hypothetical protein BCP01_124 [Bacillus phage BCP01]